MWSYGPDVQKLLERYVKLRATRLLPYIKELASNVTLKGVPTMRPLAYEFPTDKGAADVSDQYMLGPSLLVAPVTAENATTKEVYFPCDKDGATEWRSYWDDKTVVKCGKRVSVAAPLEDIPVYVRGEAVM